MFQINMNLVFDWQQYFNTLGAGTVKKMGLFM